MSPIDDFLNGTPSPQAPAGQPSEIDAFLNPPPKKRTLASVANDTVIEAANAAAGGVSAAANFVRPGNAVSGWIDKNIVEAGEANQSDAVKAQKQRFRQDVGNAGGVIMDEVGAVGRYVVNNPGLAAAQAVGSFVGPGAAVKAGRTLASIAGLNAARGGLAGGAAAGAAMAGGDAAGTAYELASKAGATDEQAVAAGRGASVLPAVIGGVGGVVGAERLVAGAKGFAGNAASRALKTGAVEGTQEAIEEGVTQYEGQRGAMPYDSAIDPSKGVAAAAAMGAALGGATGAGASLLTGGPSAAGMSDTTPALNQQAQAAIEPVATSTIDPNAGPLSKAASMAGDLGLAPVPAAPTAQEQRAHLEATIARLPDAEQREARLNLADVDREGLPVGVRAMRNARLQELVGGAPAAPVELTPGDMEPGRVVQNFDARAPDLPPLADYAPLIEEAMEPEYRAQYQALLVTATDSERPVAERDAAAEALHRTFSPELLESAGGVRPVPDTRLTLRDRAPTRYDNSLDFTAPAAPAPVPDAAAERINQLALDADLTPGQPMQLNNAHALRRAAAAEGLTMSVIPHPSGRGYDVAPTARLDPAARAAMPQDETAAQLQYDKSATGRLVSTPDGSVRAETRPEAVARGNAAAAQRQQVEAERQRRSELGLSNITPVAPVTEAGNPALRQVFFDNALTGRMVAGADGVRQERRAEVVNRANQPAPAPQTVVSNSGAPFPSRQSAQRELQRQQLASTHEVMPAGGDETLGFVLQERDRNQGAALTAQAQGAIESVARRTANWRTNAMQANRVARSMGMDTKQRAELEDALGQLYLSSLPDLSWAKHGIHRKGTAGFSQDARRAFAQNVFHGASYLAKLRYGDRLQDELGEMQRRVDAGSTDSGFDSVKAQQVVDEMVKRHDAAMNPKTNAVSTALTSLGFMFHLGLSPASAMVNLTQTALVAYPVMAAKWGFKNASTALLKASGEAARGKNDITGSLSAEEKGAFDEAVRSGVIDVTMAHDLAGIAQGEDQNVSYKLRPVMRAASFLFHHAEKFNRQVTFVAAYRLAREAGAGDKAAYEQAVQATYEGHFDYSSNNRPRAMQGNVARVLLLFKQYGQNMVYTLARNAHQSLKGATPEERAQARKALGGLLTMHGLAAGALGLPMVTTLLAAASMLGGDDDEPWDAQVALQNMLADTFGQKPAEVMAHGLSRLTPWDISGRVGLDKLIFPDVQEGLEGQRLGESAMAAALGPVAGIGINALKGVQLMGEGQYLRGLESMAPSVLRGPLKSLRYGTEGVRDKSGIVVQDEVDGASLLGQAAGFSPSGVRNAYEGKSAIVQHDRALQARRSALVEQFAMAAMAGDEEGKAAAREDIAKFNEKNPNRRIQAMQLAQSVNMRQKRIREAEEGVYLPSRRRDAMEAGRFAVGP